MALCYPTGEAILKGDRIRYGGSPGVVDFVADPFAFDPETQYYVDEHGGGCMLMTAAFGAVFLSEPDVDEDSELVARAGAA